MDNVETATGWASTPAPADADLLRNLALAYTVFTDNGRRDEVKALFWDDAVWDGTELGYGVGTGPEEIAEIIFSHYDPARPMFHFNGPLLLNGLGDDEVRVYSWCIASRRSDGPVIYFAYDDVVRRHPSRGWLYSYRRLVYQKKVG